MTNQSMNLEKNKKVTNINDVIMYSVAVQTFGVQLAEK